MTVTTDSSTSQYAAATRSKARAKEANLPRRKNDHHAQTRRRLPFRLRALLNSIHGKSPPTWRETVAKIALLAAIAALLAGILTQRNARAGGATEAPDTLQRSLMKIAEAVDATSLQRMLTFDAAQNRGQLCEVSLRESFDLICEPDWAWVRRREEWAREKARRDVRSASPGASAADWGHFWEEDCNEVGACPEAEVIGVGEGGRWVCEPQRITSMTPAVDYCLIYSIGLSSGDLQFHGAAAQRLPLCDVHVFGAEHIDQARRPARVRVHEVEIGDGSSLVNESLLHLQTRMEGIRERGARWSVEILKMDIQKERWGQVRAALDAGRIPTARQVLLDVHRGNTSAPRELLQAFERHGYVMWKKTVDQRTHGAVVFLSFIRLKWHSIPN